MLGAQALGLPHPSPRLRSPCWNWQAVTLGGDPSRFSGQKVLCRAVQARAGLRDREHEVSGQKFAGLAGSCRLVPHAARPGSRDGPTRPARLARGGIVLARLPLRGPRPMAFGVSARAFHSPGGKAERARKRPAPGDSRARPAPCLAAPPAPPRPRALTCAARRRRPQQQQQQQQRRRRGQQRGARAQRAARFPAGVDVHAGGARGGARRDPRGRGARPGQRTRWGRHDLRKAWGASAARSLCGGGSPARVGARARPRAGRLDLGPRGGRDPARLARPRLLQLLRLLLASPGRRRPATRSPCALRSSEVLSQPRGRGVRT